MKNMRKQKQRKLEKKRRKDKQERKAATAPPLPYFGNKYRQDKFIFAILAAETAIHEADVMSDNCLTDRDVWFALGNMIDRLRKGSFPDLASLYKEERLEFEVTDFIIWDIHVRWQMLFEKHGTIARDSLIGILRTILGSIETHGTHSPNSTGYLEFLEDFLQRVGMNV